VIPGARRALVTGASGLLGRRLVRAWGEERTVVVGRDPARLAKTFPRARAVGWDGASLLAPDALEGVDVVLHLAGEPVAEGRWTDAKKARIRDSRVAGTRAVVESIAAAAAPPRVLVSASAVGYYGDRGDEVLDEDSAPGDDFLAEVCRAWESEAARAGALGCRVVSLRIGIVLAEDGGALERMTTVFKAGVGGKLGSGKQWFPWIHADDVVGLFQLAATTESLSGALNATAPQPVTNAELTKALAHALGRVAFLPAPAFALRLALGEMASAVLASQRAVPKRALAAGYVFRFTDLAAALAAVV